MKKLLIMTVSALMWLLFCAQSYGQNFEKKENNLTENYNIPPGVVFSMKFDTALDLSYKLNGNANLKSYNDSEIRVGKILSPEQLESLKGIDIANYEYYSSANLYFDTLSEKVKELYTKNELWYIYVFDQNLKNKLTTIK